MNEIRKSKASGSKVGQTFLSAGSGDFPVSPTFGSSLERGASGSRGAGKRPEPAASKGCPTDFGSTWCPAAAAHTGFKITTDNINLSAQIIV